MSKRVCDSQSCAKSEEAIPFQKCGACERAFYCSKDCQTLDWPRHRQMCKKVKEFNMLIQGQPVDFDRLCDDLESIMVDAAFGVRVHLHVPRFTTQEVDAMIDAVRVMAISGGSALRFYQMCLAVRGALYPMEAPEQTEEEIAQAIDNASPSTYGYLCTARLAVASAIDWEKALLVSLAYHQDIEERTSRMAAACYLYTLCALLDFNACSGGDLHDSPLRSPLLQTNNKLIAITHHQAEIPKLVQAVIFEQTGKMLFEDLGDAPQALKYLHEAQNLLKGETGELKTTCFIRGKRLLPCIIDCMMWADGFGETFDSLEEGFYQHRIKTLKDMTDGTWVDPTREFDEWCAKATPAEAEALAECCARISFALGRCMYLFRRRYDRALEHLLVAYDDRPIKDGNDFSIKIGDWLARVLTDMGEHEQAAAEIDEKLAGKKGLHTSAYRQAKRLLKSGLDDEAELVLRPYLQDLDEKILPKVDPVIFRDLIEPLNQLAGILDRKGSGEEARDLRKRYDKFWSKRRALNEEAILEAREQVTRAAGSRQRKKKAGSKKNKRSRRRRRRAAAAAAQGEESKAAGSKEEEVADRQPQPEEEEEEEEKEVAECAICLCFEEEEGDEEDNNPFISLSCNHRFHGACFQAWRSACRNKGLSFVSCPCCRDAVPA